MNNQDDEAERYPSPRMPELFWSAVGIVLIVVLMIFDTWVKP